MASSLSSNIGNINEKYIDNNRAWINNGNANNYTRSGIYPVGSSWTNVPSLGLYGILEVEAPKADTINQRIIGTGPKFAYREFRSGAWTSWQELALKSNLPRLTEFVQENSVKTITFAGQAMRRTTYGWLMVCGQSGMIEPIAFGFAGNGRYSGDITGVFVAPNTSNVTASGYSITIPASIGGAWGTITMYMLYNESTLTFTITTG